MNPAHHAKDEQAGETAKNKPVSPKPVSHRLRYFFSFLILMLLIWGTWRACSSDSAFVSDKPYRIAQQRILSQVSFSGRERNIEAFVNDLLREIAHEQGVKLQLFSVSTGHAFLGLESGDYDAIVTTLIPNTANRQEFIFSDPLYRFGAVLILRDDDAAKSIADMQGRIIGLPREQSTFFQVAIHPDLIFYSYDDDIDALEDLEDGQLDGVIMNAFHAYNLVLGPFRGRLKVATNPLTDEGLRLTTYKKARFSEAIPNFDAGLERLKQNGTYDDLLQKWGLINTEVYP